MVCADSPGAEALIGVVAEVAAAGGDGSVLVRRIAALVASDENDRFPACAVSGPASDGRLAVLVHGDATAGVMGGDGPVVLVGTDAITSVNRLVTGPVTEIRLELAGAGGPDTRFRLDSGIVPGAGVVVEVTAGDAPAVAPEPVLASEADLAPMHGAGRSEGHVAEQVGEAAAESEPAADRVGEAAAESERAADRVGEAAPESEPAKQVGEAAPESLPAEQVGGAAPESLPAADRVGEAAAESLPTEQVGEAAPESVPAEQVDEAAPEQPFALEHLLPPEQRTAPEDEPAPIASTVDPDYPPKPTAEEASAAPQAPVYDLPAKPGMYLPPEAPVAVHAAEDVGAADLGTEAPPAAGQSLGLLVLDDGTSFRLDVDYVIGREPQHDPDVVAGDARPLKIEDAEGVVSRKHLRVTVGGWEVRVTDLGSANGTYVQIPDIPQPLQLVPGQPAVIPPGTMVNIGRRWLRYEADRNP